MDLKIDFLSDIYNNTQNMIRLADNKANFSILLHGVFISTISSTLILSGVFGKINNLCNPVQISFILSLLLFIGCTISGFLLSIMVYKARTNVLNEGKNQKGLIYFGQVSQFKSDDEYIFCIKKLNESNIIEEYGRQIYRISAIAKLKMNYVNYSIICLIMELILVIILMGFIEFLIYFD